jgi:molybdopterin converting factor small subunit
MSITVDIGAAFFQGDELNKAHFFKVQGSTVGKCISIVVEKKPQLRPLLFVPEGDFVEPIYIYVNSTPIIYNRFAYPVKNGDEIRVCPGGE